MPQRKDATKGDTAAMVAIGGSAGAILVGSTLERALIGIVMGMAVGLGVDAIWRTLRSRPIVRSAAPTAHPV
jgi:hypothetical protein